MQSRKAAAGETGRGREPSPQARARAPGAVAPDAAHDGRASCSVKINPCSAPGQVYYYLLAAPMSAKVLRALTCARVVQLDALISAQAPRDAARVRQGVGRRGRRGGGGRKDARCRTLEPGGRRRAAVEARRAGRGGAGGRARLGLGGGLRGRARRGVGRRQLVSLCFCVNTAVCKQETNLKRPPPRHGPPPPPPQPKRGRGGKGRGRGRGRGDAAYQPTSSGGGARGPRSTSAV